MGEITSLIEDVQKDKDQFAKLEQAMEPLINKYMRKLYKDDKDDVYAELILALWEAVTKLIREQSASGQRKKQLTIF